MQGEKAVNKYLTRADLYARGWNISLVRRHMPEPDMLSGGGSGKRAQRPSCLYLSGRVEAVEATRKFQRDQARSKELSSRAIALVREKKKHLFQVVDSAIFSPPDMTFAKALELAEAQGEGDLKDLRGRALDILCGQMRSDACATIDSFAWHAGIREARIRYARRKLHHIGSLYPSLLRDVEDRLQGSQMSGS